MRWVVGVPLHFAAAVGVEKFGEILAAAGSPAAGYNVTHFPENVILSGGALAPQTRIARSWLARAMPIRKPALSLRLSSSDDEDVTELSDGLAAVSVQRRQGSFSLSETMTFDSEDIRLRRAQP